MGNDPIPLSYSTPLILVPIMWNFATQPAFVLGFSSSHPTLGAGMNGRPPKRSHSKNHAIWTPVHAPRYTHKNSININILLYTYSFYSAFVVPEIHQIRMDRNLKHDHSVWSNCLVRFYLRLPQSMDWLVENRPKRDGQYYINRPNLTWNVFMALSCAIQ